MNKKSNAMLVFILFSTEENLVSFLYCCFAKVFPSHFTESKDVPTVPVHSLEFSPAALSVIVLHVPVMMSVPRISDGAPVVYSIPPCWCMAWSLLTRAAIDQYDLVVGDLNYHEMTTNN